MMNEDDHPEDDLEGDFGDFVTELPLGEKSAGPAADEFEEVEGRFWNAPFTGDGAMLVGAIGEKRREGEEKWRGQQDAPIDRAREPAEGVGGSGE